jgi:HD-GYP domain-containing protein (c-di-GMP phosphodiesterase class II)
MHFKDEKDRRILEIFLIVVTLGTAVLFAQMGTYKVVVLNLFYLPIILSGYYLGRTSAGVLALLCVLTVTIATTLVATGFGAFDTPLMMGLMLTIWGAVLGLAAILVGTLCDERAATVRELHRAYVGVVEVLSKYLQGGNTRVKARSVRIAELSQLVAEKLHLSVKQVDDIRVAALLYDLGNVEVTTQVISKAFDTLEGNVPKHTFPGTELVHSLASVLDGALPLLAGQDEAVQDYLASGERSPCQPTPIGARIIRTVRAYDDLVSGAIAGLREQPAGALRRLRLDQHGGYETPVLDALESVVTTTKAPAPLESTLA